MTSILQLIRSFILAFRWWIIILPWEQGIRVRWGKKVKLLNSGPHLKLPFIDLIFVQNMRSRMAHIPTQTVSTKDGKTVTLGAAVAYSIEDVNKLYSSLHDADATIMNLCQVAIAQIVLLQNAADLNPIDLGNKATEIVNLQQYGLTNIQVCITDFAFVKTFRLIQDSRYSYTSGINTAMPALNDTVGPAR